MVTPPSRRRLSAVSLLQQSALWADLLRHAPTPVLRHHAAGVERFFQTLHEETVLTHSVLPDLSGPEVPHPDRLLGPGAHAERVALEPRRALSFLEALIDRRVRVSVRQG